MIAQLQKQHRPARAYQHFSTIHGPLEEAALRVPKDHTALQLTCRARLSLCRAADRYSHVPLSSDARHRVHSEPLHTTHRNHSRCDGAIFPVRPAEVRLPIPRIESSSEDLVQVL